MPKFKKCPYCRFFVKKLYYLCDYIRNGEIARNQQKKKGLKCRVEKSKTREEFPRLRGEI